MRFGAFWAPRTLSHARTPWLQAAGGPGFVPLPCRLLAATVGAMGVGGDRVARERARARPRTARARCDADPRTPASHFEPISYRQNPSPPTLPRPLSHAAPRARLNRASNPSRPARLPVHRPRMSQGDDRVRRARPGSKHRDPSGSKGQSGSSNRHNRLVCLHRYCTCTRCSQGAARRGHLSPEPASPRTCVRTCVPQRHSASRPATPWAPCVPSPPMVGQSPASAHTS